MTSSASSEDGADPARVQDNRRGARTMALFRQAAVKADARSGLCVVKNLSPGGAMIWTRMALAVDEPVTLVMPSGRHAAARVRWRQSDLSGVAFDEETPPSWLLDRYTEFAEGGACRQLPRVAVTAPASVTDCIGTCEATTCDVSTHGMRLATGRALTIGAITIAVNGLGQIHARSLWSVNAQSGCVFDRPLSIDEVTGWLGSLDNEAER